MEELSAEAAQDAEKIAKRFSAYQTDPIQRAAYEAALQAASEEHRLKREALKNTAIEAMVLRDRTRSAAGQAGLAHRDKVFAALGAEAIVKEIVLIELEKADPQMRAQALAEAEANRVKLDAEIKELNARVQKEKEAVENARLQENAEKLNKKIAEAQQKAAADKAKADADAAAAKADEEKAKQQPGDDAPMAQPTVAPPPPPSKAKSTTKLPQATSSSSASGSSSSSPQQQSSSDTKAAPAAAAKKSLAELAEEKSRNLKKTVTSPTAFQKAEEEKLRNIVIPPSAQTDDQSPSANLMTSSLIAESPALKAFGMKGAVSAQISQKLKAQYDALHDAKKLSTPKLGGDSFKPEALLFETSIMKLSELEAEFKRVFESGIDTAIKNAYQDVMAENPQFAPQSSSKPPSPEMPKSKVSVWAVVNNPNVGNNAAVIGKIEERIKTQYEQYIVDENAKIDAWNKAEKERVEKENSQKSAFSQFFSGNVAFVPKAHIVAQIQDFSIQNLKSLSESKSSVSRSKQFDDLQKAFGGKLFSDIVQQVYDDVNPEGGMSSTTSSPGTSSSSTSASSPLASPPSPKEDTDLKSRLERLKKARMSDSVNKGGKQESWDDDE